MTPEILGIATLEARYLFGPDAQAEWTGAAWRILAAGRELGRGPTIVDSLRNARARNPEITRSADA